MTKASPLHLIDRLQFPWLTAFCYSEFFNLLWQKFFIIGTSEKLLTSIIKQNWRQESIGVHVQNIQNFLIADREPI